MRTRVQVGDRVTTRNGEQQGRVICIARACEIYPLVALMNVDGAPHELITIAMGNGKHLANGEESQFDLIKVETERDVVSSDKDEYLLTRAWDILEVDWLEALTRVKHLLETTPRDALFAIDLHLTNDVCSSKASVYEKANGDKK